MNSPHDVPCFTNKPRNAQIINETWELVVSKGWKKSALYYRILDLHKSKKIELNLGDLILIGNLLEYSEHWVSFKVEELGMLIY